MKRVGVFGKSYQTIYKWIEENRIAGRRYYPVTNINQLLGMDFDETVESTGAYKMKDYDKVQDYLQTRNPK